MNSQDAKRFQALPPKALGFLDPKRCRVIMVPVLAKITRSVEEKEEGQPSCFFFRRFTSCSILA